MLPFEPQQFEEVKARFPVALMSTYDCRSGIPSPTPGELRAHVFDFTDGLRLIVSRDKEDGDAPYIHVSASAIEGTTLWFGIKRGMVTRTKLLEFAMKHYRRISGDESKFEFCGFSIGKGVPHWRRRES